MNEKTIVTSMNHKSKAIPHKALIIGLCMIALAVVLRIAVPRHHYVYDRYLMQYLPVADPIFESLFVPDNGLDWVISPLVYLGIGLVIASVVYILAYSKITLTVTDKRVYGTAAWNKRVDLPLDMISAVSTSFLNGIAVATSSGRIDFKGITNNQQIHAEISKLLMERQKRDKGTAQNQAASTSGLEELTKLKELLDQGIITQEEFDAKKKQLLGL